MSLIRLLKKRRRIGVPRCATPEESQRADRLSMRLAMLARRPETILVNIQSVVNDLVVDPNQQIAIDWRETPHMTPPYPSMWMEAVALGQRFALQVLRDAGGQPAQDGRSGFKTVIYFWQEENAEVVGPSGQSTLWLDETGGVTSAEFRVIGELHEPPDEVESGQQILTFIAAHALARMNCRNVVLRPWQHPRSRADANVTSCRRPCGTTSTSTMCRRSGQPAEGYPAAKNRGCADSGCAATLPTTAKERACSATPSCAACSGSPSTSAATPNSAM